jgi:Phage-related baseplate assembly protein.
MTRFDRNQTSLIEKSIRENTRNTKVGIVNQVFEHSASDDDSNFEANVLVDGKTNELKRVPVFTPASGLISPPRNGDKVLVMFIEGETFRPVIIGSGFSNIDRPPLGKAGMYRNRFESGQSPLGAGDLYFTGYTQYDDLVASNDKRDLTPEESVVQITKHAEGGNMNPTSGNTVPAKVEVRDSPKNDEAWVSVELNKVDGSDSDATWGMRFNIKTGEWKLVGPSGFGITSDGDGNFVWHHKDIEFDEVAGSTGPLSL